MSNFTVKSNIIGAVTLMSEDAKSAILCALFRMKHIKSVQEVEIKRTTAKTASKANVEVVDERGMVYHFYITITPSPILV